MNLRTRSIFVKNPVSEPYLTYFTSRMNQPPAIATLIALLLAIRDPHVTLSSDEQEELFIVGEQLELDPDDWEITHAELMSAINSNPKLNQSFTKYQAELISFLAAENDDNLACLPSKEAVLEKLQVRKQPITELGPHPGTVETRGPLPINSQRYQSNRIINDIVVPILKSKNPPEISKSLFQVFLEKLSQFSADSGNLPTSPL